MTSGRMVWRHAISSSQALFIAGVVLLLVKHGTAQSTSINEEFSTEEEQPVGTYIGTIGEQAPEAPPPYILLYPYGETASAIDTTEFGRIQVKKVFDRETNSQYEFLAVSVTTGRNIHVTINVLDINDHHPTFNHSVMTKQILESTPRDVKFALGSAIDPDLALNSTQRYEIMSGNVNSAFRLGSKLAPNGILYLDLEINGELDYESIPSYDLVINAYDGANPPLFGTMYLHILIVDVNDNQPTFNQSRYFAQVPENIAVGSQVLQVFASDMDSGVNGEINYLIDRQRSDQDEQFNIDPIRGIMYISKELDFETQSSYELIVVAQDNGTQRLQTTAIVSVTVLDVNDNEPSINIIFLTDDGTARIPETMQAGEFVARISVSDPDVDDYYSNVSVTLNGGDGHFGLTTRDNVVYLVILSQPLDREMEPFYTLTVVATDSGQPPLEAEMSFTVVVMDNNDNPPEFTQTTYYADIQEVLPIGSSVIQVAAVDRDEGNNSQIRYELLDTPEFHSDWFRIDSTSGLIMTATRVDCETSAEPQLTIRATDSGVPPLSSLATVIVHIRDVNDNQPIFDQSFYNVSVPENQLVGTCILQVSATDPDCGINGQVTYTIALNMGFDPPHELNVRNTTGQVCVAQPLDFETKPSYEFPIMARDQDGLDTIAIIKITLQDINDNSPVFMPSQYNVNVEYDGRSDDEVVAVAATDADLGNFGTITYSIVGGNSLGLFSIHAQTGVITLNSTPSSSIHIYMLQVRATDGGGLWDQADVTVNVLDPSQQPPAFTESLYQLVVMEGVSSGALVGTVTAHNTNPAAGAIIYSIVSGDTNQYFTVDATTGQLRTRNTLDHDTVPYVLITVQAQSGTPPSFGRAQVNVTIGDINDNAPVFSVPVIQLPLREDTPLNSPIYYVHATDADSRDNGQVSYSLQDSSGNFIINAETGQLKLLSSLDYEQSSTHSLLVLAEDGGMPMQQATMTIDIDVQDVNDNTPTFSQTTYTASVMETAALNTQFTHVTATDRDAGNNGRITYLLAAGQSVELFGVYPDTGYLYTQGHLDRELSDHYTVIVVAMDNGIPPRSATATVQINILDENDNSPVFQEEEYHFGLEENQQPGVEVGYVSASDPDLTDNRHIQYSILSGNLYFAIDQSTGRITTRRAVDRETQELHSFRVEASDLGIPPHTAVVTVNVAVLDFNDNPPVFQHSSPYSVYIKENKPKGSLVAQISSSDSDVGANAAITYMFSTADTAAQYFSIDAQNGRLTTREVLDAEAQSRYTLHVLAKDGGVPMQVTELVVTVIVEDLNDSPPEFPSQSVSFNVEENTAPGTIIGNVHAEDSDSGENAHIFYYIVGGNLFGTFAINRTTGDIIAEVLVDYEISSNYTMVVLATDNSALNPMSSEIVISINIIDHNDNAPKFVDNPILVSVQENRPVGTEVYTFRAQDPDSGSYGNVRYAILSQSPAGDWFTLDAATGVLTINQLIDYEANHQFAIVIQATDQPDDGANPLSSSVTALINIEDVNDNAPVFQTRTEFGILEDEPEGYPVLHAIATDADDHDNGRVTYAVVSGNELGHFALDANSGLLTVVHMLDHEDIREFHLNISARDHGYPMHISYIGITLSVLDVNDNPPRMEQAVYSATVEENKPWGTFVTQIHATDSDTGMNAQLTYLIPPGIADNKFKVGLTSGDISTNATLDREVQDHWVITAYVRDNAFPALYDTTTINVQVIDMNDNSPEFKTPLYYLYLPENEDMSQVHAVLASDGDAGAFGEITYDISSGNVDGRFSINTDTGMLSCTALDREVTASYELIIQATDGGVPPRTSTATVMVTVMDENDNSPLFTSSYYSISIAENLGPDRSILQVSASDGDEGNNAVISFSLNNTAEGLFSINNVTGEIKTAGDFDREKKASYTFEVYAMDGGRYGPRISNARIEITILDINDNAPVFDQIPYRVNISQTQGTGQYVTKVTASDADIGMNGEVRYSFSSSTVYFNIDGPSGTITTRQQLGSAAIGMHRLEVVATDRGQPPLTSTGVAEIYVGSSGGSSDLRFTSLEYTASISESAPAGTRIVQVGAEFVSGSGSISYSIVSGNEEGTFYIAPSTGVITVSNPAALDYELSPQKRLTVMASSSGNSFGYTTVSVSLQDANDNAPRFMQDMYISAVWEGNSRGTYVTQIQAVDADEGSNANIMYTIIGGNVQEAFVITQPYTGIVKTNIILDREILDSYRLEIEAMDEGNPPLTSRCTLKIQVVDVNDNAPFFPQYTPINIPEGVDLGVQILQVTANDRDLSPTLVYDFTSDGNPGSAFNIDRYSGRISVARQLDFEQQRSYGLKITASDQDHEVLTEVTVNVQDENDNPPVFMQQSYQVTLEETTAAQRSVVAVTAVDLDDAQNGNVTYAMIGSDDFYINELTGVIYSAVEVAFNPSQPMVHLVVIAKDHGDPQLNAVVAVRIQIIDVNNNAPQFAQAEYEEHISENYPVGSSVMSVVASDADDAYENRKVDYSIVSGNVGNKFQISSSTGEVLLTSPLDREVTAQYSLTVMARDHGTPPQSSTVIVMMTVDDVNDNAPQFTMDTYTRSVREDVRVGTSILTVSAVDDDAGLNGQVQYSFTSGNDDEKFEIDSSSGTIYVQSELDAETTDSHRLVVQAIDSSQNEPQLSSIVTVLINVSDVNEYSPLFPVMMYLENVQENLPLGTSVFTAHANDRDAGFYGEITYSLPISYTYFTIDTKTGVVSTAYIFDYDSTQSYTFNVTATDNGGRITRAPCLVAIEPGTFLPSFSRDDYQFSLPGDAKAGYQVGSVQAYDADGSRSTLIRYRFQESHEYFGIDSMTGLITVIKDLQDSSDSQARKKRSTHSLQRSRRALQESDITLRVIAETGGSTANQAVVEINMSVDRSCEGCAVVPLGQTSEGFGGTPLVLVILFIIVGIVAVVVVVVLYLRGRERKRHLPEEAYGGSLDSMNIHPPPLPPDMPPNYNEIHHYAHQTTTDHNMTTSEISDQSHSASSGRGSAEDGDDVDEEIRMINATPMTTAQKVTTPQGPGSRMPDSGIQQDDDTQSLQSVQNHQEYLARLGIDSSALKSPVKPIVGSSVESMHTFTEQGGGEAANTPHTYHKLEPMEGHEHDTSSEGTREFRYVQKSPGQAGSLSSVINSEEEFSGSYNWDYLLDWGPQYQPLAHVFTEIAKLKDDSIKPPKKQPTHIVPQRQPHGGLAPQVRTIIPPPLLTSAPPKAVVLAQPVTARPNHGAGGSQRISQMTSVPTMPRSPINHESSFTSPAMSPSFTPSLSPLATRSPSISPLGNGSAPKGAPHPRDLSMPSHAHRTNANFVALGNHDAEQEIHI